MKIAFITKPFQVEWLGIGYLSSVLKKEGHDVCLFKTTDIDNINKFGPNILAYSVLTGQHEFYIKLNKEIKKTGMISIFGGAHPTYFPKIENSIDWIVRGEAEISFPKLLNDIKNGINTNNSIIDPVSLIQNLDEIPFPDREFLYTYSENKNNPIKNVMTSRGCPFSCPYCFNSIYRKMYKGQKWIRFRSPKNVISECLELKQYPLKMIYFQDDEFISNPKYFELLELYKENVKVPFHCQLRIELLTEEKAQKLKESGCCGVTFAIESGNDKIRTELLQRKISKKQIFDGVKLLKKFKLNYRSENMVGIPGETINEMLETVNLNQSINPTIGWCSIFQPYPNLPLSDYALSHNHWNGKVDMKESFFEESVLNDSKNEIVNLQRLFSLAVWLKIPTPMLKQLIKLPNNKLYNYIHNYTKKLKYKKLYNE